ncbi:MAG: CHAT domain-containing protein, partial [Fimbriimonadaceae bacterium]
KWKSALRRFELAANAFRRAGNQVWLAYARARAAVARMESSGEGIVALRAAVQKLGKAKAYRLYAECMLDLAHWEAKQGTLPPDRLRQCQSALARLGGSREEWRLEEITARASGEVTRLTAALAALARERDRLASPILRAAFMRGKEGLLGQYVSVLAQTSGGAQEAIIAVRTHRAVGFVEEIAALRSDALPQGLTSTMARLRDELASLGRDDLRRSSPRSDAELSLLTEWSEAHLTLSSATTNILEKVPAPDLVWVGSDEATHVLSGDTIRSIGLGRAETARRLRALRFEIAGAPLDGAADVAQAEAAIRALADLLPRELPHRTLCPEGQLWQVPWCALVEPGAEPVLALAPFAPEVATTLPSDPKVLVWEADWDDLPHAREEGELVYSRFPGSRVCRSLAEARESLADGSYDLLHVATHARAHPNSPLFSTISFPDGDLYAFEVMSSPARIGAVVLTACEAASVGGANPFEPEGTGRAFLSRGASVVVGPIWPLDDKAGKTFVEWLYDNLGRGVGWTESVASARQKVRDKMPHPYYWAPFATLGGYR